MNRPIANPTSAAPYFEDLEVGQVDAGVPALTVTSGHAAAHQAVLGDRLRLPLDAHLSSRVIGRSAALVHPALVCDVAIGQSTLLTQRVIGNLFYRGLTLRRAPVIGDTLYTVTEVVALRQNRPKPGRAATGLAVLRIRTVDQEDREVLDFHRCAMLPLQDSDGTTDRADSIETEPPELDPGTLGASVADWDLKLFREEVPGSHLDDLAEGANWAVTGGDVVSAAPELARLSLNVAIAHHDAGASGSGRRLVYGGHTIGLAASQITRAIPNLVTIVAWHSCDHLGPVFEGDTLHSDIELEGVEALASGVGGLVHLRSQVRAVREEGTFEVLDWHLAGIMA